MLIFSGSLAKCLEATNLSLEGDINTELCRITQEQFSENTTVSGVAQSVVDKVVRQHRDYFETEVDDSVESWRRDDVTLLVRNFNEKLASSKRRSAGGSTTTTTNTTNNLDVVTITKEPLQKQRPHPEATRSSTTTESSADTSVKTDRELSVDENGKIKPYVDFSHFHEQWHLQFD
jgi:TAK1-binding protein 1